MNLDPRKFYKILRASEWQELVANGESCGSSNDLRDGYIHLSNADQLQGTLIRHFAGVDDLMLVAVDPAMLGAMVKHEPSRTGALFAHLYAPLPLAACRLLAQRQSATSDWSDGADSRS